MQPPSRFSLVILDPPEEGCELPYTRTVWSREVEPGIRDGALEGLERSQLQCQEGAAGLWIWVAWGPSGKLGQHLGEGATDCSSGFQVGACGQWGGAPYTHTMAACVRKCPPRVQQKHWWQQQVAKGAMYPGQRPWIKKQALFLIWGFEEVGWHINFMFMCQN